jgi:DNA-binding CsgD family transcriptional regulator
MVKLDETDVEALSAAIQDIRAVPTAQAFPLQSLEITAALVRNDSLSWNEIDPATGRTFAMVHPYMIIDPEQLALFSALQHEHPIINYLQQSGDGSARKISDFLTRQQFRELRLYQDVYRTLGVEHQIALTLPTVFPRIEAIAANRADPDDDFDERDRLLLNVLRPHLAQAYAGARERDQVLRLMATMSEALSEDGTGVIVLDDQPAEVTVDALMLLYRYFGRPAARDPFPDRISRWLAGQRRIISSVGAGLPDALRPIVAQRDGRQLVVRFLPPTESVQGALLLNERRDPSTAAELQQLGLTVREAEILDMLASGATNTELAAALHISSGTVKKHLDNLYRKLGVTGRVQAVGMALTLLPRTRQSERRGH